jgi:hypothetical protein
MTYVRRKRFTRKPKDVLVLALLNLWPGDELLCTNRTYEAIQNRLKVFRQSRQDIRLATMSSGAVRKIRRVL